MNPKLFLWLLTAILLVPLDRAEAQQPKKKVPRIGFLHSRSPGTAVKNLDACLQALTGLGYLEGENIRYEYRYAEGKLDRLPELAADLTRLKVDVIVTGPGTAAARAAKVATATLPIVVVILTDPVGSGLMTSLSHPGGNLTGLTFDSTPEQAGKNLELFHEAVPKASPIAILRYPKNRLHMLFSKEVEKIAKFLGVTVNFAEIPPSNDEELENAFRNIVHGRAKGLLVFASAFFADRRAQIVSFAAQNKLPAMYPGSAFVDEGGLMSYGASSVDLWPRAATYVHKILKGAKPADLPAEQPKKFDFVLNLKTAKQIGVIIPPNVLARADRVIK